jgi:VIT1/CCC1 family predicted Fe2+/Mn2+ transporter
VSLKNGTPERLSLSGSHGQRPWVKQVLIFNPQCGRVSEVEAKMRHSLEVGFSFGLTSGVITTLGLMIGLHSGTHSKIAVIGGILTIAIADAFSDALGIHISEESEGAHSTKEVWESTIATFLAKFIIALTFIVPVLVLALSTAMIASIVYGLVAVCALSYALAKKGGNRPFGVISEHLLITALVIITTHYAGELIASLFGG